MWGFPKFIADIDIHGPARPRRRGVARSTHDGDRVLTLSIGAGRAGAVAGTALDAFSYRDGVLRRTRWSLHGRGSRMRPGGARVELGDHPIAERAARPRASRAAR